jgi:hypothetical protein
MSAAGVNANASQQHKSISNLSIEFFTDRRPFQHGAEKLD